MTYRRQPGSFAAAWSACLGFAADLGVSDNRLRQLSNPHRRDTATQDLAARADILAARAGLGCPHFEAHRAALIAAGVLPEADAKVRLARLTRAVQRCLAELAGALAPVPVRGAA